MLHFFTGLTLRLLRVATNTFFCFEFNRFLGRAARGSITHRKRSLPSAEAALLARIQADVVTTYVTVPGGIRIHTIIAGKAATRTPGDHNPIVLFHGHSMFGATFYRNVDDLLRLGFTSVYMPDLPGFGQSSRPMFVGGGADAAIDYFATPLLSWLKELGLKHFTLGGHSLGGYIAHECALRISEQSRNALREEDRVHIPRLIMIAPAAIRRPACMTHALWFSLTPQRFLTYGGLLAQLLFASKYPSSPAYNEPGMRRFALMSNSISHRSGDAAAAAILQFSRPRVLAWQAECTRPLLERATRLDCPIQLVVGTSDALVPVDALRELYATLAKHGNDVAVSVVHGADHCPHILKPTAFAKAVSRFDVSLRVVNGRIKRLAKMSDSTTFAYR